MAESGFYLTSGAFFQGRGDFGQGLSSEADQGFGLVLPAVTELRGIDPARLGAAMRADDTPAEANATGAAAPADYAPAVPTASIPAAPAQDQPVAAPQPAAAAFTAGNIVVYRVGNGTAALTSAATIVALDEYDTAGNLLQAIGLPTADRGAHQMLTASGTATSEGLLTRSADGQYLILTGYDAAVGTTGITTSTSTAVQRVIGRVDFDGNVDTSTTLGTAFSGASPRGAVSLDGTSYWADGGATGVVTATHGATTSTVVASTVTNLRGIAIADGQLYVSSGSDTLRLGSVGTGTPITAGETITNLTGFPTATLSPYQFFFADLSADVAGVDTLYVADDRPTVSGGGLLKFSLVGGTWVDNGRASSGFTVGLRGLAGETTGTSVQFYATTAQTTGNSIVTLIDTGGYNATFSTLTFGIFATASANTAFRGVAFAPQQGPGPAGELAIADLVQAEGDTGTEYFTFEVTRSGGSGGAVSATWTLGLTGTASADDFTATPQTGTVNFIDGQTYAVVTVTVAGDTIAEADETFFVTLSDPTGGATLADAEAQATITSEEHAPVGVADTIYVDEDATTGNLWPALRSNDSDADAGTVLTITAVDTIGTLGSVIFDAGTQTLRYVADANSFDELAYTAIALDTFSYTLSDGVNTATATVTVNVSGTADINVGYFPTAGNNTFTGNDGEDELFGLGGVDTLSGGKGHDWLEGGIGNDILTGGEGLDTFVMRQGDKHDFITDFDKANDRLLISGGGTVGKATVFDFNNDGIMDLRIKLFWGGVLGGSVTLLGIDSLAGVRIDTVAVAYSPSESGGWVDWSVPPVATAEALHWL
jgi:VCBS repeat-containing protein